MRSTVKRGPRTKLVKQMHMRAEKQRMLEYFIDSRIRAYEKREAELAAQLPSISSDDEDEANGFIR